MVTVALYVELEARPGKGAEVAELLEDSLALAQQEDATVNWYAIKFGSTHYAVFDTFEDEAGRAAHMRGKIARMLEQRSTELFVRPPALRRADILGAKQAQ